MNLIIIIFVLINKPVDEPKSLPIKEPWVIIKEAPYLTGPAAAEDISEDDWHKS